MSRLVGLCPGLSRFKLSVEVVGQIRWFCTDEIVPLQEAARIQAQALVGSNPPDD